jgi:hypothetical protein
MGPITDSLRSLNSSKIGPRPIRRVRQLHEPTPLRPTPHTTAVADNYIDPFTFHSTRRSAAHQRTVPICVKPPSRRRLPRGLHPLVQLDSWFSPPITGADGQPNCAQCPPAEPKLAHARFRPSQTTPSPPEISLCIQRNRATSVALYVLHRLNSISYGDCLIYLQRPRRTNNPKDLFSTFWRPGAIRPPLGPSALWSPCKRLATLALSLGDVSQLTRAGGQAHRYIYFRLHPQMGSATAHSAHLPNYPTPPTD